MWRDLLGRRPEPSGELSSALADLDRLARSRPELDSPARALGRVLAAAFGAAPRLRAHEPAPDPSRLAEGPAFAASPPEFDPAELRARAEVIARSLSGENPEARALIGSRARWGTLAEAASRGDDSGIGPEARSLGIDPALLAAVLRLTVLPVLAASSAALARDRPAAPAEDSGLCPNCGRPPSLAELRGLEGRRFLRCGWCAADWPAPRLGCVNCGESRPDAVRSLAVEGEADRARLARCDTCGFALKVVATLSPLSPPALLVAELATIHLDFLDPPAP